MSEGEVEEMEAEIIQVVYAPGSRYSHAEEVLQRLTHLEERMDHTSAVRLLHAEVMKEVAS